LTKIFVNQKHISAKWRDEIFSGSIYLLSQFQQPKLLGDFAEECIKEHFGQTDYLNSYLEWPKEEYVERTSRLKGQYTNCMEVKEIIRNYLIEMDEDPAQYLFDVPRLRVIPNFDYMHVGVSYTYKPHRDTWYGSPACQINFWMPIFTIDPAETMPIYPAYFEQSIDNSSGSFDLKQWVEVQRSLAVKQITIESREHPTANEDIKTDGGLRFAGNRGDMLAFSAHHLHGSQKNTGENIRFSTDFRLFHIDDVSNSKGPIGFDDGSKNKKYVFKDLFRASDFSKYG
jgi:hypothetical protein